MTEPIRVLHVDDEPGFAALATAFLGREDDRFVVEPATSTDAALDVLAAGAFDCVVSDYELPGLDGPRHRERRRRRESRGHGRRDQQPTAESRIATYR